VLIKISLSRSCPPIDEWIKTISFLIQCAFKILLGKTEEERKEGRRGVMVFINWKLIDRGGAGGGKS
jgi:hypothetical protein